MYEIKMKTAPQVMCKDMITTLKTKASSDCQAKVSPSEFPNIMVNLQRCKGVEVKHCSFFRVCPVALTITTFFFYKPVPHAWCHLYFSNR